MELTKEYFDQVISNLASKDDLNVVRAEVQEINSKLGSEINDIRSNVAILQNDLTSVKTDIVALQEDFRYVKSSLNQINQTLVNLDKRDKEDSDSIAKILVKHDQQIEKLEKDFGDLKLRQA